MSSARVNCPYCSAKLRIATDGGMSVRAKCRICKKTFMPSFIFDPAGEAPTPAISLSRVDPVVQIAPSATPVDAPLQNVTISSPSAPPMPVDAVGRHRRRKRVADRPVGQLRPYEVALASALILAVLGGLGYLAYQLYFQPKGLSVVQTVDGVPEQAPIAAEPFPIATTDLTLKPRPKRLAGAWELRADDGRTGRLILRADGTLTASSTTGDSPLADYNGKWFLLDEDGDRYVLEFSRERGGLDGYKVTLLLTNPDAFTLIETVKGGLPIRDFQRFVRAAGPSAAAATAP
jgi:hypothetical protein